MFGLWCQKKSRRKQQPIKTPSISLDIEKQPDDEDCWVVFIYIAARNDLYPYSRRNIREILSVGSNSRIKIIIDYHEIGKKGTQRFFMEKGNAKLVHVDPNIIDSGNPESLIDFIRWGVQHYQGTKYALILWDHGTSSCLDPHMSRSIETSELFESHLLSDLMEGVSAPGFPDFITEEPSYYPKKGSCFDDVHRSYFNSHGFMYALQVIRDEILHKMWDVIGLDECLMADVGTAAITQDYAVYQVSSAQAEPGWGWRYDLILQPFLEANLTPEEFAKHIVKSYDKAYHASIHTPDYTLSAFKLSEYSRLERNIDEVAEIAIQCLVHQKGRAVKDALRLSYNKRLCISYDEPTLKCLGSIWANILKNMSLFQFNDEHIGTKLKHKLTSKINEGQSIIKDFVIASCAGRAVSQASGITIYAPETRIHSSFMKTKFAKKGNRWCDLIKLLLIP